MAGLNMSSGKGLNKNEKFLIGVLSVVAIGYLVFTFIIEPSNKKLKPLKEEVLAKQAQVKNLDMLQLNIAKKEKELSGLKEKYDKASDSIPKTDRYPQVIKDIEKMAVANGVTIKSSTFGKPIVFSGNDAQAQQQDVKSGLTTFTVSLTVGGNYNQILDFIKSIESDTRISEIPTFSVNKDSASMTILYYTAGGIETEEYDFNTGTYGKGNLFE